MFIYMYSCSFCNREFKSKSACNLYFGTNPGRHMGGSSKEVRTGLFQGSNMGSTPVPPTTVKQASRDDGIGSTPSDSMTNYC